MENVIKFRELNEKENNVANIGDFRDKNDHKVILLCEHATNCTHDLNLSNNDKKFIDKHWGYDIGAFNIMNEIAKKCKLFSLSTNFSRLIIDPNRILISNTLVRKKVEIDHILDLNRDVIENDRIERFYLPYYSVLKDSLNFIKPNYICSIHTFTQNYEKNKKREMEVGLLLKDETSHIAKVFIEKFEKSDIKYKINEPYCYGDSDTAFQYLMLYNYPNIAEGILIEIRNDLAEREEYIKKFVDIISECLNILNS